MRSSRVLPHALAALLILAALAAATGCLHPNGEASIEPLPAAGRSEPGLGPGTLSLSSGPGYKGSPTWSPRGDRIAFTVDGYVVDKPVRAGTVRRWTTKDFVAEKAEWTDGGGLAILTAAPRDAGAPRKVYGASPDEGSFGVQEVAAEGLAMGLGPEGAGLAVALKTGPGESKLAPAAARGRVGRPYAEVSDGLISGFSFSPSGRRAVVAVRRPGHTISHELRVFDLREGMVDTVKLDGSLGAFGAPQWTDHGIYYVAGEEEESEKAGEEESTGLYGLYPAPYSPGGAARPERAPGVGEDFVAASARVSPDGGRLAVIGRLNPESPTNLYVQDVGAEDLKAATANEDMEIKTGPEDLAWSPDGDSVAIVARGAPSEEPAVHDDPADVLLKDFYNLYEVSVE